jgi:hypothetical protein
MYNQTSLPDPNASIPPVRVSFIILFPLLSNDGVSVAAPVAAATAVVRSSWAAGAVMACLIHHSFAAGAVVFDLVVVSDPEGYKLHWRVSMWKQASNAGRTYECDEEEDDVHDSQRKAGLEHGASLVQMERKRIPQLPANRAKGAQAQVDVVRGGVKVRAIGTRNASQLVHPSNQCAHEAEIDEGNEGPAGSRAMIHDERANRPSSSQN